ncbi:MAG: site-specific DNA-methyltransferase [Ignavibacteriaceae bacterium]|nr:site-specific DNA-methyltransferase [Ignavibacteriaceae bacterium]
MEKLKQLFPETVTEGKIDWEKLQATLGKENIEFLNERYVLNWAGKSEAFKVLQQSTTATLKPAPEESINFDTTENVFIEGENLEVLKVLQKAYYGKIKCIIIDPPYNTGNDSFIYPDSFKESKEDYQKRIGEKDEEGYLLKEGFFRKNSKDSGHYHSNWLSMMYPRLFLAKNLLRDEGVIFVHIDDNEVHNLRLIMNEILGEENFLAQIVWQRAFSPINLKKNFSESHDYILCYCKNFSIFELKGLARNEDSLDRYKNPDNDYRGVWASGGLDVGPAIQEKIYPITTPSGRIVNPPSGYCWRYTKEKFEEMVKNNRIWFGQNGDNVPRIKRFLTEVKERVTPMTLWLRDEVGDSQSASRELKKLFDDKAYFEYPKPVELIKRCIDLSTKENDIILDFFSGSGTTAQAVLELNKEDGGNRKFILVQLPEKCDESSEAYKAGYKTIADISKERIRRVINKLQTEAEEIKKKKEGELQLTTDHSPLATDLGFKVFKLSSSNFKIWRGNEITEENLELQLGHFTNPVREVNEKENLPVRQACILYELILKAGYLLTDKVAFRQAQGGKGNYYSVNDGELIIALEEMNQKIIDSIISAKPKKVITLDKLFTGNDQLKTNTVLQMRDAEIDFKTI